MIAILAATFLGGCTLGAFAVLVLGIHIEEHRRIATHLARLTRSEAAARQVMGVHVRKPSYTNQDER